MSEYGKCPGCGTALVKAEALAIYCPNKDCQVFDGPDLWDGHGNKEDELHFPIESVGRVTAEQITALKEAYAQLDMITQRRKDRELRLGIGGL